MKLLTLTLILLALIFFLLAAFQVPKASWRDFGYACLVAAYLSARM